MLWSIALLSSGLFIGFIFGVPKSNPDLLSLQKTRVNTNLEDISDWLTKIIVGTGLIELKNAPRHLNILAMKMAEIFGIQTQGAVSFCLSLSIAFPILGFLLGFLAVRFWLQREFARSDSLLPTFKKLQGKIRENRNDIDQLAAAALDAPPKPSPLDHQSYQLWESDPHKGQFGGKAEVNKRILKARIKPIFNDICQIDLTVESLDTAQPLTGKVIFYLHPTFDKPVIQQEVSSSGIAELTINAVGAFTVGAVTNDGTRLELDLMDVDGGTEEFYKN